MWKDKVQERYWWAHIQDQLDELIYELSKAEEEEAALFYLLGLHLNDLSDLEFFNVKEQVKIKKLLGDLMIFSHDHSGLLTQALQILREQKKRNARSAI